MKNERTCFTHLTRSPSLDSLAYASVQATTGPLLQRAEQQRSFLGHTSITSYTILLVEVWSHT